MGTSLYSTSEKGLEMAMLLLVLLSILGHSLAQDASTTARPGPPDWFLKLQAYANKQDDVIDRVHNFRLEYHPDGTNYNGNHLLMAISDFRQRECHVIEVDAQWEPLLNDPEKIPLISEEIIHLIQEGHAREVTLTDDELYKNYGRNDATEECANHVVKAMIYSPSDAVINA